MDNISNELPQRHSQNKKKVIWNSVLLLVVIGVGIWLGIKLPNDFNKTGNMKSFGQAFSEMNPVFAIISVSLLLIYMASDALKYLIISRTSTHKGNFLVSLKTALLGKFYDNITPSSTGGQPMQIIYLHSKGFNVAEGTAIAVTRFFVQMFAWSIFGLVIMIIGTPQVYTYVTDVNLRTTLITMSWIGFALVTFLPFFTISFVVFPKFTLWVCKICIHLGHKVKIIKNEDKALKKSRKGVDIFTSSIKILIRKPFRFLLLIILSFMEPLLTASFPYFILLSFSGDAFAWSNYFSVSTLYMYAHNSAAVFITPGNEGAFEATLSIALSGISTNVSVWVIFMFRIFSFYSYIFIGLGMLLYEFIGNVKKNRKLEKQFINKISNLEPLPEPENKKSVSVLLSTYNGSKYLREQLMSLVKQRCVDMKLVVRDDGSKDETVNIINEYETQGRIFKKILGDNIGFQKSFHSLLEEAPKSDFYAFCDQDDIWDEDKLFYGVKALENEDRNIPLLYWTAFRSIDKNGNVYKAYSKRVNFKKNSLPLFIDLNTNDIRGCTCVFNEKAREMMLSMGKDGYRFHDWVLQLICVTFGKEIYDPIPHMSYRCHDDNCFGPAKISLASLKRAMKFLKTTEYNNHHSIAAKEFYDCFKDQLNKDQKDLLESIVFYREDKEKKKKLLKSKDLFESLPFYLSFHYRFLIKCNKY